MPKKIIKGTKANSTVEIFGDRSVNDLIPSLVHLGDSTCRIALEDVCGGDFKSKMILDTKQVCKALNISELTLRSTLYGEAGEILRRHMVQTKTRVNLWTPKSIVILATILHHRSEACRGISMKVIPHCSAGFQKPKKTQVPACVEAIPVPVKAKVQAAHPVPVEAHMVETTAKVPVPNEISVVLRAGTLLKVAAI